MVRILIVYYECLHIKYLYSIVQVPNDCGVPDNIYTGGQDVIYRK